MILEPLCVGGGCEEEKNRIIRNTLFIINNLFHFHRKSLKDNNELHLLIRSIEDQIEENGGLEECEANEFNY